MPARGLLALEICVLSFALIAGRCAASNQAAPGPTWWPGSGSRYFATAAAACGSPQFAAAYLGTARASFDHVGPTDGADRRFWCWFVIAREDGSSELVPITIVHPTCPPGGQLSGEYKADGSAYACTCGRQARYVEAKARCEDAPVKSATPK
ncbi:MAG: hypothetical protein JO269_09875 [Burkholderiaceae bacterium]|nr:hypothetical protein [Burkholderiaceae bacterium]